MTQQFSHTSATSHEERRQGDSPSGAGSAAIPAAPALSLSRQAMAAMVHPDQLPPASAGLSTPSDNMGCSLGHTQCAPLGGAGGDPRQSPANAGGFEPEAVKASASETAPVGASMTDHQRDDAANCTPPGVPARKARPSRAKRTTAAMENFLGQFFFDWLSATVPNGKTGSGEKRRAAPDKPDHAEDRAGLAEEEAATLLLNRFAVAHGLHRRRLGNVRDGYGGGNFFGASPVEGDHFVVVRTGHSTVMPSIDISGGDGRCATLAPLALRELGPLNISRADVSHDHSAEGYFDALVAYAEADTSRPSRPRIVDEGHGRTMYWGKRSDEAMVRVYEKDMERVAKKKLPADQADPHLVRVEISINPPSADKAAMGKLAAERGPGALLGAIVWVRRFVERVAVLTGNAKTAHAVWRSVALTACRCPDPARRGRMKC